MIHLITTVILLSTLKVEINNLKAENSLLKEQLHLKEYERNVFRTQMQKQAKDNLALGKINENEKKEKQELKKENEELKKEIEALKKKNETLIPVESQNSLESSETQIIPRSPSIDTPPPLFEPQLAQTPAQQDITNDRVRQYLRDRSPEISEPLDVSDSESGDDNPVSDVPIEQLCPSISSNQKQKMYNEKAKQKAEMKSKKRAKKLMSKALSQPDPWKCVICPCIFSNSNALRQHVEATHPDQKHFCKFCPCSDKHASRIKLHEEVHGKNEAKYKNSIGGRECKLCKIWFRRTRHLEYHLRQYHLPNDS